MARYKKIYRDEQRELDIKRDRIRKIIDICVTLFWVVDIVVMGLNQNDRYIVGTGSLVMGVINGIYVCFSFWALKHWRIVTVFDSDELWRNKYLLDRKMIEKTIQETAVKRKIVTVLVATTAVFFSVAGIAILIGWL